MTRVTYERALVWLNDRVGRSATAIVEVHTAGLSTGVVSHHGTLEHWTADQRVDPLAALSVPGDNLGGWYHLAEGLSLNLSDLDDSATVFNVQAGVVETDDGQRLPYDELRIDIDERVLLHLRVLL